MSVPEREGTKSQIPSEPLLSSSSASPCSTGSSESSFASSSSSLRVNKSTATNDKKFAAPKAKVMFEGSTIKSNDGQGNGVRHKTRQEKKYRGFDNQLGGYSRTGLTPLTPLTPIQKGSEPEGKRLSQQGSILARQAFSSPNLKALHDSNYERARLLELYRLHAMQQGQNYVDPFYRELNPSTRSKKSKPVWSLNQPLPHVLDPALTRKMQQKSADAKFQASFSRPPSAAGSADVSRATSTSSLSEWKRAFRRATSSRKLTDLEAQRPAPSDPDVKTSKIHIGAEGPITNMNFKGQHNAEFTLGGDSYQNSIKDISVDPPIPVNESAPTRNEIEVGPTISNPDIGRPLSEDAEPMTFPNFWAKIRYKMREPFSEFLGTLILVIFGVGGNLQATVTKGAGGSYESLSFAWGFGCMLGVYVAGGVSGGHVNPAVTISMAIFRKFPWRKVPVYIFAQIVGAFFGGAMAYGYFWSSITKFEGGPHIRTAASGGCLFTNPKPYVTWRNAFFDEFIGAAILVGCLMALLDDSNAPPTNGMTALIVGFLVAAIGMALGYQTSFTINPARDLGPRIFASMIGYGPHAFHLTHWWWTWGTWGGPIAGGITGALVYDVFIFTGCESPINYPDNGYVEHRVKAILRREPDMQSRPETPETEIDRSSNSEAPVSDTKLG
ncbi:LADA_0F15588g1_1 [Lachancea dasiensis]|uniref:LADA_0F15588g1_1 n=1 Tax=Lachancea dasiensis TaxID=1072105 RepID=A0A1G4JNL6_9SACH|nr:LADA_0F15588g1_1 [Lachancea dasiensis]